MDEALVDRWMTLADLGTKKVSYAQNGEDILLERALPHADGFYVDAGANDPVFHSATKRFSERGWRGLNIEPNPRLCDRLRADRPRDVTVNVGLADGEGRLTFFDVPAYHGWSTFVPEAAEHYRGLGVDVVERTIPVTTLARLCAAHADRPIDFLKVDVEGFERQALAGADWARWRPRVVVVEATWPETWEAILLGHDYLLAAFDGLNRYYVRAEDRDLLPRLAAPVNALDNAVPYEVVRLVRELDDLTRAHEAFRAELGATGIAWARRLRHAALRYPRLAGAVKRLLRRAG